MNSWPRLDLKQGEPATVIFTASLANDDIRQLLGDDFNFEVSLRKLSLEQQLKISNVKHDRIKALCVTFLTQVTLNYVLYSLGVAQEFDPFRELPIVCGKYGKPHLNLDGGPEIHYNLSSSEDILAIVVQVNASTPVGIDLSHEWQHGVNELNFEEKFNDAFSPQELKQLADIEDLAKRYLFFNQLWTLKEAFTKFVGCGLNIELPSISFDASPGMITPVKPVMIPLKHYKRYELTWQRDIGVDYEKLDENFKCQIADAPIFCQSSVVRRGCLLPVYVSLVSQTKVESVDAYDINLADVVQFIIDSLNNKGVTSMLKSIGERFTWK